MNSTAARSDTNDSRGKRGTLGWMSSLLRETEPVPGIHRRGEANIQRAVVHVVGFDDNMRVSVCELLNAVGAEAKTYPDVGTCLRGECFDVPGCLLVHAGISSRGGLEFLIHFQRPGVTPPIVVVADRADVRMAVLAMKAGAVDFLENPLRSEDLLEAVGAAIRIDDERRHASRFCAELHARFETLTPREREVMALVTQGLLNKQVAFELGVSEITVKVHRGSVMRKMGARALTDLVRMADAIGAPLASRSETKAQHQIEPAPAGVAVQAI